VLCTVFYEEAKPAMYFKRIAWDSGQNTCI
jgi:hypothetical protein